MSSASEYRQYARECVESAAKASTEVERRTFLDMARTWENAALAIEEQDRLLTKHRFESARPTRATASTINSAGGNAPQWRLR
jgi:hypothetical protein